MANRPKLASKKEFTHQLEEACGIITSACKLVGISRETYRQWCMQDPEFKQSCEEAIKHGRERGLDRAESALFRNIEDGKETSCIFYLKTQGKHRGYIEKQERTDDPNDLINIIMPILTDEQLSILHNRMKQSKD